MKRPIIFLLTFTFAIMDIGYPHDGPVVYPMNNGWTLKKTDSFDTYYPSDSDPFISRAQALLETCFYDVADFYRHETTSVIPVIFYPFQNFPEEHSVPVSLCFTKTIAYGADPGPEIVVPFQFSLSDLRKVLLYKLSCAVQNNILLQPCPALSINYRNAASVPEWIREGMTGYVTFGFDATTRMVMEDLVRTGSFKGTQGLEKNGVNKLVRQKAGQAFFYYLEKTMGPGAAGELLRLLRSRGSLKDVIPSLTGKTLDEFNTSFTRYFQDMAGPDKVETGPVTPVSPALTGRGEFYINTCAALSPDGRRVAFLSIGDGTSRIVISGTEAGEKNEVPVTVNIDETEARQELYYIHNSLSWTGDGKKIVFTERHGSRDAVTIADARNGSVVDRIYFPMHGITDPSVSYDGEVIVLTGASFLSTDLYLYTIRTKELVRLTSDACIKRYPVITADGRTVVYCSGPCEDKDSTGYDIFAIDISTGTKKVLIRNGGDDLNPSVSRDGSRIAYISNSTGRFNLYLYDVLTGKSLAVTDTLSGVFSPALNSTGDLVWYSEYSGGRYDLYRKKLLPR